MHSPVYLQYQMGQRAEELRRSADRARWLAELPKERSDSCRSRLARKLVALGFRLDGEAASSALHMQPVVR